MKLLIISSGSLPLPPVKGGAVEHLIDLFLKYNEDKHGYDITVVSINNNEAKIESGKYNNCEFEFVGLDSIFDKYQKYVRYLINRIPNIYIGNAYINKVKQQIKNFNKYDAVIIENSPEYGLFLRGLVKGKLILHLHNDYLHPKSKLSNKIYDSFDEIYALSNFVTNRVKEISKSEKVHTLYNGIDLKKFNRYTNSNPSVRVRYGIEKDDIVVMYSGRIVPEKGVQELVQAFTSISKRKNMKLLIVGSPKYGSTVSNQYFQDLKSMAAPYKNQIIFTGYIPYEEMPELYAIANIGVVPSLCNDGFNLTVVEFMANSIPVIVSDNGAMKELINSECGIIVSSKIDISKEISVAIQILANNKEKYIKMSEQALKQSENFSKQKYCERFTFLLSKRD